MSYIDKSYFANRANQQRAIQVSSEITGCLIQCSYSVGTNISMAAYLLYKASQFVNPFSITIENLDAHELGISTKTVGWFQKNISDDLLNRMLQLINDYSTEDFALATLLPYSDFDMRGAMTTPESIISLAKTILNVCKDDNVADICCGSGTYLVSSALDENQAKYYGYEINAETSILAEAKADVINANIDVVQCDAFELANVDEDTKFTKIFANYPFGLKLKNLGAGTEYLERLSAQYPGLSKATSSDWVFNALLCDLLAENGKAIGIMTNGSTSNSIDMPMRKYFIEQGLVECVISLPSRMFTSTNIPTTMIVLSHGNDSVRMIDATKLCQQGRRQNEFSEQDIKTIIQAMSTDSEFSKALSLDELSRNEYSLSLSRYVNDGLSFSNGVTFESIIKSITRGAPCTASQLDGMVSDSITSYQYLMLGNIQHGMIDDKLPYLSSIDPKYEKYCLKNNTLILSKNGYPYKVAVASVKEGQTILANGNLYIIELDETKANPYYIKAFFESDQGSAVLKSITVGATIPNIGVDKLKKVMIPLPPLEEQAIVARKYRSALDEITEIKLQLENAISKLRHIFDEVNE